VIKFLYSKVGTIQKMVIVWKASIENKAVEDKFCSSTHFLKLRKMDFVTKSGLFMIYRIIVDNE